MKRLLTLMLLSALVFSCKKYDDSAVWEKLNSHEARIAYLEELCKSINANIASLNKLIEAIDNKDHITTVSPLATGDGYTFVFKSGTSIVVHNGKDGQNGENGKTPVVSVAKDSDGLYYWTLDGTWLLVDGEKVRASAKDGVSGVTPQFKIEEGYWYVKYGEEWERLGPATASELIGTNGDSFFKCADIEGEFVKFVLNDGKDSVIKIPYQTEGWLEIEQEEGGKLRLLVDEGTARTVTCLKIKGYINYDDMVYIQHFSALRELDLSESTYEDGEHYNSFYLNPYGSMALNKTLCKVWFPKVEAGGYHYYSYCFALKHVIISQDNTNWGSSSDDRMSFCPSMETLEYAEGTTTIQDDCCLYFKDGAKEYKYITSSKYKKAILPSTTTSVDINFLRYTGIGTSKVYVEDYVVICKATTPPTITGINKSITYTITNCTLYVPSESVKAYKAHDRWKQFNVLPIE